MKVVIQRVVVPVVAVAVVVVVENQLTNYLRKENYYDDPVKFAKLVEQSRIALFR